MTLPIGRRIPFGFATVTAVSVTGGDAALTVTAQRPPDHAAQRHPHV